MDREYTERDDILPFRNAGNNRNADTRLLVYAPHNTGVARYDRTSGYMCNKTYLPPCFLALHKAVDSSASAKAWSTTVPAVSGVGQAVVSCSFSS